MAQTAVSPEVRAVLLETYPGAANDRVLMRYLAYALYTPWYDRETGERIISMEILEWIWGRPFINGETCGKKVIDVLRRSVAGLEARPWIPKKRCRTIIDDGLASDLTAAVKEDLSDPAPMDERVLLLTGRTVNSKDTQRLRKAQYEAAMAWRDQAPSDTALYNFERMNDRPSNAFRKILPYVPEARDALDRMDIRVDTKKSLSAYERENKEEGVRDYYRRVLSAIEMQPQPFYRFSARGATDRIFSSNPSFLLLPGGIRNILCQEFVVADLSSAGLAICAKLWNCEQTLSFLRDGGDVWKELCSYLGASPGLYGKVKDGIKGPLHATEYGLCAPGVKGMVTKAVGGLLGKQAGQRFGRHWMLQELFEARDRELKILRDRGYGVGPGGETVPIPEDGDENSVMATIVQRWEQKLMQPVLELEERHHAGGKAYWRVMYWLHDAVALHFTRSRGKYLRAIQEMVEARAATYGIPTRLMVAS